jgi:hypothetical protein
MRLKKQVLKNGPERTDAGPAPRPHSLYGLTPLFFAGFPRKMGQITDLPVVIVRPRAVPGGKNRLRLSAGTRKITDGFALFGKIVWESRKGG